MRDRNPLVIVAVCGLALFALASGCSSGPSKGSEVGNPTEDDIAAPLLQTVRLTDRIELRYSDRFVFAGSSGSYELTEASDGSRAATIAVMPVDAATLLTIRSCPVAARFSGWSGLGACQVDDRLYATDETNLVVFEFQKAIDLTNELRLVLTDAGSDGGSGGQGAQMTGLKGIDLAGFISGIPNGPDIHIIETEPSEPSLFVIGQQADGEDASGGPDMQIVTPEEALGHPLMIVPGAGGGSLPPNAVDTIDVDVVKVIKNVHDVFGQP